MTPDQAYQRLLASQNPTGIQGPAAPNYLGNNTYGSSRGTVHERRPEAAHVQRLLQEHFAAGNAGTAETLGQIEAQALEDELAAVDLLGDPRTQKKALRMFQRDDIMNEELGGPKAEIESDTLFKMYNKLLGVDY